MTVHSAHPATHENGLQDGCPRCAEHADRPFDGLDDRNLGNLIARVRAKEPPRSVNEDNAMRVVWRAIGRAERLTRCGWNMAGLPHE